MRHALSLSAIVALTAPNAALSFVPRRGTSSVATPLTARTAPLTPIRHSATASGDAPLASDLFRASAIDDVNTPPSLSYLLTTLRELKSGSDIRGQFVDHSRTGSLVSVVHSIQSREGEGLPPPLTPLAAFCFGHSFGAMVKDRTGKQGEDEEVSICIGRDPRPHGVRLADAFARGAESIGGVKAVYNGLATTPAMFEFCRAGLCDGGTMITASHLPEDRNGIKLFTHDGGFSKADIDLLIDGAAAEAHHWHDYGLLPPTSGDGAVQCSDHVDYMPHYRTRLRDAIVREVGGGDDKPLQGLRIVLNAGNGAGYFFNDVLAELGADVSQSMLLSPDGTFPAGVPNPESKSMIEATMARCEESNADIGILFDTDADRAGFILPRTVGESSHSDYEPLNRNRLIALLSVIFADSSPGCTIVTDSVTSEGLADFLVDDLDLKHVRYLKGYANVISKAREITEGGLGNAEMAIETSGHCAMRENGYLDDGTYTAVKVVGLLARAAKGGGAGSLLDLISGMKEMPVEDELRMSVLDGSLNSTQSIFDEFAGAIEQHASGQNEDGWELDKENLEGVRVRSGGGGFFMLRKSLHDPLISLQVEGESADDVRSRVISPILDMVKANADITNGLDLGVLHNF